MSDLNSLFFSPIGKEYCWYFRILMYITFLGVIVTVIGTITHLLTAKQKHYGIPHIMAIAQTILSYFVMRLFYSMCIN